MLLSVWKYYDVSDVHRTLNFKSVSFNAWQKKKKKKN